MNKIAFARLLSHVSFLCGRSFSYDEIESFDRIINDGVSKKDCFVDPAVVDDLLKSVKESRKIEAIKAYRNLTNAGLKESKDAIEKIIP